MKTLALLAIALNACGGAVAAPTDPPSPEPPPAVSAEPEPCPAGTLCPAVKDPACPRIGPWAAQLEAAGCRLPSDVEAALAAREPEACTSLAMGLDECVADRYCAEDMAVRVVELCGGPGPAWRTLP